MGKSILNRHLILSSNKKKVSFHLISLKSYNYPQNKHPAPIRNPTLQNKKQFPIERLKILSNWATIKSEAPGTIRIALSFLFVNQALKEAGSIALVLETKRTWGGEKLEGLREERTDDPGIVSKSFRGAFFLSFFPPLPLPFRKKRKEATERKNTEKKRERERESASQSKVSKKYQEARGRGLNVDDVLQTGRSSPVEKLRTEMNPSKWTGAFYGPPFLLDRLRDFSESIYQNVPKKELDNEDPWVRGTIPAALGVRNLSPPPIFAVSRPWNDRLPRKEIVFLPLSEW